MLIVCAADRNFSDGACLGILNRILDQISQHETQHGRITLNLRQLFNLPMNRTSSCFQLKIPLHFSNQLIHVENRVAHLGAPHPGKC